MPTLMDARSDPREPGFVEPLKISIDGQDYWLEAPSQGFINRWRKTLSREKEPRTIPWLMKALSDPGSRIFWDVGANVGVFSVVARRFSPDVKIVAFEPEPNNFRSLCNTSMINGLNILAHPIALSSETGIEVFNIRGKFATGLSFHQLGEGNLSKRETAATIGMAAFAGDDLVYKYQMDSPDILKIDVDGIEDKVMRGFSRLISERMITWIAIEVSDETGPEIIRQLKDAGYVFATEPDGTSMLYFRRG
jgi:FkbM family methyltransferase